MANSFGGGGARGLRLSNSATDVFLSVLQFALSDLAVSRWERQLAQWVGWHDQNVAGRGCVGFDLEDVAWDRADFRTQKAFLLRAVDAALAGHRWDELCCDPPYVKQHLREYRDVVDQFGLPAPDGGASMRWGWPNAEDGETFCPNHGVHCSDLGWCRVCDDCGPTPGADDEHSTGDV